MNRINDLKAIVLAGGKGTRLQDSGKPLPKVLREANGKPLLSYVLDSVSFIDTDDIMIVVGFMHEAVMEKFSGCRFIKQGEAAYGTGYAAMCGLEALDIPAGYKGDIIILQGDTPLVKRSTVEKLIALHRERRNACTLLSCVSQRELPFGRIQRAEDGTVKAIVEQKDCTPEQLLIRELNVGMYIFNADKLKNSLSRIGSDNKAGEYYLTDTIDVLSRDGERLDAYITDDETEMWGVNTFEDLRAVEEILRNR